MITDYHTKYYAGGKSVNRIGQSLFNAFVEIVRFLFFILLTRYIPSGVYSCVLPPPPSSHNYIIITDLLSFGHPFVL